MARMRREDRVGGGKRRFRADAYVFAALCLFSFSVLLFSVQSFFAGFRDMGLSMYSGLRGSIHELTSFFSKTVNTVQELANLNREYNELSARVARYEQLERNAADIRLENERLREQLDFAQTVSYRYIAGEKIGYDPSNLFSAFVINKGKSHGVAVNMPVVAYQNGMETLAGKVVQAAQFESLVMPLYDTGCFVPSRLAESRFEGIVEGLGSPNSPLVMRFVRGRTREEINAGELVVSSGLGGVYPPGIGLGRVVRALYQNNDTTVELELTSIVDYSRLEYVFVINARGGEGQDGAPAGGAGDG
jgi:rod shape-determining protein MreC